ncbi:MAG: DUF423 domain-containing protein [Gammaproteobacteria bacterium]
MLNLIIPQTIIPVGALSAFIAVAAGAFAAHGLKDLLSIEYINTFKTAADYQMIHSIGLILIGILNKLNADHRTTRRNSVAAVFMFFGIILFSGSLYLLTLTGTRWLGMITPLGGACFLIAWLMLAFNYWPRKE